MMSMNLNGFVSCDTLSTNDVLLQTTMRLHPLTTSDAFLYDSENSSLADSIHDESSNISENSINSLASSNDENSMNVSNVNMEPPAKHEQNQYVKRPMNAFMLWSQIQRREISAKNPRMRNSEISCQLGKRWKLMTDLERKPFVDQSARLRAEHTRLYPDYKYRPKKKATTRRTKCATSDGAVNSPKISSSMFRVEGNNPCQLHTSSFLQLQRDNITVYNTGIPSTNTWNAMSGYMERPSGLTLSRNVGEIGSLRAFDGNLAVSPDKNIVCGGRGHYLSNTSSSPWNELTLEEEGCHQEMESYLFFNGDLSNDLNYYDHELQPPPPYIHTDQPPLYAGLK